MDLRKFDIWLANLSPQFGTEACKTRPVVIVQSDMLNSVLPSTVILPITSNVRLHSELLRLHLQSGETGLEKESDIMIEQIRSIDKTRLLKKIGELPNNLRGDLEINIKIVLDL